jgi:hypothetical protein
MSGKQNKYTSASTFWNEEEEDGSSFKVDFSRKPKAIVSGELTPSRKFLTGVRQETIFGTMRQTSHK